MMLLPVKRGDSIIKYPIFIYKEWMIKWNNNDKTLIYPGQIIELRLSK